VCEIEHEPWTTADAREYLAALASELLDSAHGYLLPFDAIVKALAGGKPAVRFGDPTSGLGYGPIERKDGLDSRGCGGDRAAAPAPLVARMRGSDHGFEVAK